MNLNKETIRSKYPQAMCITGSLGWAWHHFGEHVRVVGAVKQNRYQGHMLLLVLLFFFMVSSSASCAGKIQTVSGDVVKIIDGDSFIMKSGVRKYEIRMWGIDCPEYTQPFSSHAKSISKKLIDNKQVTVKIRYYDKYDRGIGVVYLDGVNINEELVRRGSAWVYRRYCKDAVCTKWDRLEEEARDEKRGLWRKSSPMPPWEWRRYNG